MIDSGHVSDVVNSIDRCGGDEDIQRAILALKTHGINFLAIDFDLTLVESKTEKQHNPHDVRVRELFKSLIPCAMDNGMVVAVVSFAKHLELIQTVLRVNFPSRNITVRSNHYDQHRQWSGSGCYTNKQNHIASAASEYIGLGIPISRKSTILIDDELDNIQGALNDHVNALLFNPEKPYLLISDIMEVYSTI